MSTPTAALTLLLSLSIVPPLRAADPSPSSAAPTATVAIGQVLDAFHAAAAKADEEGYFALFAPTGVFLGTDATERWDKTAFRAFAHPYFAKGTAWTFVPRNRHVDLSADGRVAWFDELLDSASYGECRGSGVLEKIDGAWKVQQYHLTIPVPNDLAKDVVAQIRAAKAADADLALARAASERAVDAEGLRTAMAAYEKVLTQEPQNYAALVALADHSILMATAYTEARGAKRDLYNRAMRLAERAMYTNPDFQRLTDRGARPWEAASVLSEREMRAMMDWMTALLYNFKECMSGPVRVANVRWITHLDPMLDRMEQLDERWEEGAIPFTRAFYYFVLPKSLGGDRKLAARSFARAVEMGPNRLVLRWGRARFFHVLTKDRAGFVADLDWVATRDPETFSDSTAWKAYIQRDAKSLLGRVDRLF